MFAERLVKLRKEKELSQYDLAKCLGLSRGQISNYELGTRKPDTDTLSKIANFFGVSVDYLLGNTSSRKIDIKSIDWFGDIERSLRSRKQKGKQLSLVDFITVPSSEGIQRSHDLKLIDRVTNDNLIDWLQLIEKANEYNISPQDLIPILEIIKQSRSTAQKKG